MTTCDKTNVWQTIENMRHLGLAVNSFYSVLESNFKEKFPEDVSFESEENELIQGDWCRISTCRSYDLNIIKPNYKNRQACPLTVRTELWREFDQNEKSNWEHAKSPLIYIGFGPDINEYWDEYYLKLNVWGLPVYDVDEGKIAEPTTDENLWLWEWQSELNKDEKEWSERDWFYAVPLFDINSTTDIQDQILDPLKALLVENKSPEEAFKGKKAIKNATTKK